MTLPPFADLPESLMLAPSERWGWAYRPFWGNPPHSPYVYGWVLRLERHTTPAEKTWLKSHGFSFSGGKWTRCDLSHAEYAALCKAGSERP